MPTISRQLASAGIADPGNLKSPSLPGASPGLPTGVWFTGNSRPVRFKTEQPWECNSPHADQLGMSTGRASRASVLTSACLRASGASPRHSATACSSKRTGGFILRIALDQCRVRERYPARRPFYTSERESLERPRSAGTKPVIETGRRCYCSCSPIRRGTTSRASPVSVRT
jgi:hypothetical protein